jgi:hypothetical protein
VAGHPAHRLPLDLDPKDPNFSRQCLDWSWTTQAEIADLIAGTKKEIAASWALLAEANRILARK